MGWICEFYLKYFRDPAKNVMGIFFTMLETTNSFPKNLELSFFFYLLPHLKYFYHHVSQFVSLTSHTQKENNKANRTMQHCTVVTIVSKVRNIQHIIKLQITLFQLKNYFILMI